MRKGHVLLMLILFLYFTTSSCGPHPAVQVNRLIRKARQNSDDEALISIAKTRDPKAIPALIKALKDKNPAIAKAAIQAFTNIGEPGAGSLVNLLYDDIREYRNRAAKALAAIGWQPVILNERVQYYYAREDWDELINLGPSASQVGRQGLIDANKNIRAASAILLGELNDSSAIEPLFDALRDSDSNVRRRSAIALSKIGEPAINQLFHNLRHAQHWRDRESAAEVLGMMGQVAVSSLLAALNDEDWYVRRRAVRALGIIADTTALQPLIELSKDPDVRNQVWEAVSQFSGQNALKRFLSAIKDEDKNVRMTAIIGLHHLRGPETVIPLLTALNDPEPVIRQHAAASLQKIKEPKTIKPLIKALTLNIMERYQTKDAIVHQDTKLRLMDALVAIGEPAVNPLISALIQKGQFDHAVEGYLRVHIVVMLGHIGSPQAIPHLIDILQDPKEAPRLKEAVAEALGQIGDKRAVEPLISYLHSRWSYQKGAIKIGGDKETAITALGQIGDPRATETLIEILKTGSKDRSPRAAARALGEIGDERAVNALVNVLQYEEASKNLGEHAAQLSAQRSSGLRSAAAEALGKIRDKSAVEPLIMALQDDPYNSSIIKSLAMIGDPRAITPLINSLLRGTSDAAKALCDLEDPEATKRLIQVGSDSTLREITRISAISAPCTRRDERALKNLSWAARHAKELSVRVQAAEALVLMQDLSTEMFIADLKSKDKFLRQYSAQMLGIIKDERATEPLIDALDDIDSSVRFSAAWALGKIGDERGINFLVASLTDWDLGGDAATALSNLGWTPLTDIDRVWFSVARRDKDVANSLKVAILIHEIDNEEDAWCALFGIGDSSAIHSLIDHLQTKGDRIMGESFLNSGNKRLANAAKVWAQEKGYSISTVGGGSNLVSWGGRN